MASKRFKDNCFETIRAVDVVEWTSGAESSRLFLPPIQRSVVWRNSQIVNYWDSLLRGYPAGLMMVHRSRHAKVGDIAKGRTVDGQTCEAGSEDFHLFDGQQRMAAILLGHQAGQLNTKMKLWVDLGMDPSADSGLLFQLRVTSTGQPFGYQPNWPNEKPTLGKRRTKIDQWRESHGLTQFDSICAFQKVEGKELIDGVHPIPLGHIISRLEKSGMVQTIIELVSQYPDILPDRIETFIQSLEKALKLPIVFQLIDASVVEDENEYIRFFQRLGQGGTSLLKDELTYSIIKHQYPEVHDRMKETIDGAAGRMASEVNLVLAALRVSKVLSPWATDKESEIICRPSPGFVSRLKEFPGVGSEFQTMIPVIPGGRLKELLEKIRERLRYDKIKNPGGLPIMLLARLPHQLVDVLLLMATQEAQLGSGIADPNILVPFVLHWLLFVGDSDKAAWKVYQRYRKSGCVTGQVAIQDLIQDFENAEIAGRIPLQAQLSQIREDIENGTHRLRAWSERFTGLDPEDDRKCGHAIRRLSTNNELIRRALMWLQRDYLAQNFSHFDPTSSRDEDLPIDLDHLIPGSKFGFHWKSRSSYLDFDDADENFRDQRYLVGGSLGNFRWLDAAENRGRGAREINVLVNDWDLIKDAEMWNNLIRAHRWSLREVATFQRLIDLRTVDVYEKLLIQGRLNSIVS